MALESLGMEKDLGKDQSEILRRAKRLDIEGIEQTVRMENIAPESVSIAGFAAIDSMRLENDRREKKSSVYSLIQQIAMIDRYLEDLERAIAETEASIELLVLQWKEKLRLAEVAFDRMHESEDLLEAIKDGISIEERERLVKLLGAEAEKASKQELIELLNREFENARNTGIENTDEADELASRIQERKRQLKDLLAERDALVSAQSHEERVTLMTNGRNNVSLAVPDSNKTVVDTLDNTEDRVEAMVNLDFDVSGFH